MRKIVNIINFIRGCEPRCEVDLVRPVIEQKRLLKQYHFPGTFLLQYDALIEPAFQDLMRQDNEENEVGVWLEIVKPLCEKAGLPWRGRFPWDWHASVGFSVGYTPKEREKLVDTLFEEFKKVFGYYPRVMGSWIIDAHTLAYAHNKYGLDASCNCKDQWGTDGYTLWGAYYNGAYYPAKNNVFAVGEGEENQIGVPIFRMLGSDPVLQYDAGLDAMLGAASWQNVITLEPVYRRAGGGDPAWVDWYFEENFNGESLSYAYTQVGQENSFGWEAMREGLYYQFEKLASREDITIETLGESGRWFLKTYKTTPPTAMVCHRDFEERGKQSAWYNSRRYRANLYADDYGVRLRDMMLFDNRYPERYLDAVEKTNVLQFDTLPIIDGNRNSGNGTLSGGYLLLDDARLLLDSMMYQEKNGALSLKLSTDHGAVLADFDENGIVFSLGEGDTRSLSLEILYDPTKTDAFRAIAGERLLFSHRGFDYAITVSGAITAEKGKILISAKNSLALQWIQEGI